VTKHDKEVFREFPRSLSSQNSKLRIMFSPSERKKNLQNGLVTPPQVRPRKYYGSAPTISMLKVSRY
jgi:hypothetical protein